MNQLFSYGLPRGSTSSIVWDLWRDLNQYLYHPALPFIVFEKRGYDKKTPSKPVLGNKIRLTLDDREKKEKTITISSSDAFFGEMNVEIHVFKHEVKQKEFINNKAVVFSLNGQVHGHRKRAFISQELGFSLLRDHMLVQVDCTKLKTSFRQDLFKGSRDRLNEGKKTEYLMDKLVNLLKSNDELKTLNQNRKNRIIKESIADKDVLSDVFSNITMDKDLLNMLKQNDAFNMFKSKSKNVPDSKPRKKKKEEKKKIVSKRFPSIFKIDLKDNAEGKKVKSIPLNGKGIVKFETDVEDEYLFRPKEKGKLQLEILGYKTNETKGGTNAKPSVVEDVFNVTKSGPTDHSIRLTFEPKEDLSVGDEVELNARLSSPKGDLEALFWVKIGKEEKEKEKIKEKKKHDEIAPPIPIRVFEVPERPEDKTWEEYGWDGNDIVKVITSSSDNGKLAIEAIAINMDCFVLKKYLAKKRKATAEELKEIKNKFFLSIYLHSLFLHGIMTKMNKDEGVGIKIDPEDALPLMFKPYSSFLVSFGMI